jgi:hypothetical protein
MAMRSRAITRRSYSLLKQGRFAAAEYRAAQVLAVELRLPPALNLLAVALKVQGHAGEATHAVAAHRADRKGRQPADDPWRSARRGRGLRYTARK